MCGRTLATDDAKGVTIIIFINIFFKTVERNMVTILQTFTLMYTVIEIDSQMYHDDFVSFKCFEVLT